MYVPLGTLIVSSSFALGSSLSNIVSSLVFVLVTRPYEVGDRVTASGILDGAEPLIVRKIDVLTTTFLRVNNKELIAPNHQLLQQNIENFKRSPTAAMKIEVSVSMNTTAAQLEGLRSRINTYLESQPLHWKPTCMIRAGRIEAQSIVLSVWAQSHYTWQDAPRLFRANWFLHIFLLEVLRQLGIGFRAADQRVSLDGSVLTSPPTAPAHAPAAAAPAGSVMGAVGTGVTLHHPTPTLLQRRSTSGALGVVPEGVPAPSFSTHALDSTAAAAAGGAPSCPSSAAEHQRGALDFHQHALTLAPRGDTAAAATREQQQQQSAALLHPLFSNPAELQKQLLLMHQFQQLYMRSLGVRIEPGQDIAGTTVRETVIQPQSSLLPTMTEHDASSAPNGSAPSHHTVGSTVSGDDRVTNTAQRDSGAVDVGAVVSPNPFL